MSNADTTVLFELCCGSADDAVYAYEGGADRVELNSAMFLGGLTPTVGALIQAKKRTPLPVMCMVRPREGGFCYTECEYAVMLEDAKILLEYGADGIVFGFLNEDGTVDAARCREMLRVIGNRVSVFHRAIDVVPDVFAALYTLISLGVTRVLTSGQRPTVGEGVEKIREMIAYAAGRIQIQPGGGIQMHDAAWCRKATGADMLHAMVHKEAFDRSAMGNPAIYFGGAIYPPEDRYKVADKDAIIRFCKQIRGQE